MKAPQTKNSGTSLVLCYLTDDWQHRLSDGPKNKGQKISYKYGITASNYEWELTEFREDSPPTVRVHASRFEDLVPSFKTEANVNPLEGMQRCQASLEMIAKLKPVFAPLKGSDLDQSIELAVQVDSAYRLNYAIHDDVRERFFGKAEDDTEE